MSDPQPLENSRQDAPGQRVQPGPGAGPGRGESKKDAGRPAAGRLGYLGGAGHDRAQAAPLVPDPQGRGPALRHRPPAPAPREEARATGLAAFHPHGELPEDYRERFALDHDHPAHLENQDASPFAVGKPVGDSEEGHGPGHEHPPWTATSRGVEMSLRRLAMLEPVYRLAPDLIRSGRFNLPADDNAASREVRMTDFRLLRHGGFYHAVARYGEDVWTPFTYAGLHATERVLRRKEQHRFWGVDSYYHEEDRYLRIGNRTFYEDPDQEVEPSAQVVVAVDSWARDLARNTLSDSTPTLFCTPDGQCTPAVELRPSRDLVSDPAGHPSVGRPESAEPGHGGHRRTGGPPAVPYHLPVPRSSTV